MKKSVPIFHLATPTLTVAVLPLSNRTSTESDMMHVEFENVGFDGKGNKMSCCP